LNRIVFFCTAKSTICDAFCRLITVCIFFLYLPKSSLRLLRLTVVSWLLVSLFAFLNEAVAYPSGMQPANVDTLNTLAERLMDYSPEQSLHYSLQSVQIALKTHYLSGHTKALNLVGLSYYRLNNYKKALQYFSQALDKATVRRQDSEAADAYEYLGHAYYGFGDYDQSLDLFFKSLRLREKIRDKKGTAQSLMQIGSVYDAWKKPQKALEYYQKSLKLWETLADQAGLAALYNHFGRLYDTQQRYKEALQFLNQSLSIHQKQKNTRGVAQSLHSIGEVYFHQQKYEQALNFYFRALKREQKLRLLASVAQSYNSIAACYGATARPQQAIFYYEKAIIQGQKAQTREPLMKAYLGMAENYQAQQNYKSAYENHRLYTAMRDSVFNSNTNVQIAEIEAKYQIENQQQEVELLRKERRINIITLRENRNLTYLMGILVLMLFVLAIVLISRYQIRQRSERLLDARNRIIRQQNAEFQDANQKLTASEADLRNMVATKDKFFTIISHDLRGPLNSLTGIFQVLLRHIDHFNRNELKNLVEEMNRSVHNVLDLLENLLHWSQTQRGGIQYEPQLLLLHEVISEVMVTFGSIAANKQIRLEATVALDVSVYADRNMLLFILRNLTDNAIKFTRAGGQVTLNAMLYDNNVEIAVTDTGIGIAPNDLPKLFRIDTYHTTNGTANETGTGLGLILCHEFVSRNGGKITVQSTLGEGTTFSFTLPAHVLVSTT